MKEKEMIANLETLWKHLDDACGSLDNAFHTLDELKDLPEDIKSQAELIDFDTIVNVKNTFEQLLEQIKEPSKL